MPLTLRRQQALPDIPTEIDASEAVIERYEFGILPFPRATTSVDTGKALSSTESGATLSVEEMTRLHELWNKAGLKACAHRRRRGRHPAPCQILAPILPAPEHTLSSAGPSITSANPATGARFFSARPFSEMQEAENKGSSALRRLRARGEDLLKKRFRSAPSAQDLDDQAKLLQQIAAQLALPVPIEVMPKYAESRHLRATSSPGPELAAPKIPELEDVEEKTPNIGRDSQGRARFQSITPVPLRGRDSFEQLLAATEEAIAASAAVELPELHLSDRFVDLIDELSAYMELRIAALAPQLGISPRSQAIGLLQTS